ncbi:MAG: 4-phosphoerythronate dehydrogenase PdxB [Pseudomonadales bacterium]|nr:4-phosphoerythronate dehydrogenase PdxB [Pseudomonadales bacterium]
MKIIADENISKVEEFFVELGEVQTLPGRAITKETVAHADVLLVRSVTPVNKVLLEGSSVKFVGTCTIGTDHVDLDYLRDQQIGFASAPGCNADAVVDYVIFALAALALNRHISLQQKTLGIVGLGNVGSRLKARAEAFGLNCLCCDPPLQHRGVEDLVPLEALLAEADIISLHTPLTHRGKDATYHLLNADNLPQIKREGILINTARGPVVDNVALKRLLSERKDICAVLDVWESEPSIDVSLLEQVSLATPHIAGYSLEGKLRGTAMIYQSVCDFFGCEQLPSLEKLWPAEKEVRLENLVGESWEKQVYQVLLQCYDIRQDSAALKALKTSNKKDIGTGFDHLRKTYPMRRELKKIKIINRSMSSPLSEKLTALGLLQSFSSELSSSSQAF